MRRGLGVGEGALGASLEWLSLLSAVSANPGCEAQSRLPLRRLLGLRSSIPRLKDELRKGPVLLIADGRLTSGEPLAKPSPRAPGIHKPTICVQIHRHSLWA
jgi:hypothetical protein